MTDIPSFQDLLNDFADEVFVGRSEQLSLFESSLQASQPPFLILNISGQGGVGKRLFWNAIAKFQKIMKSFMLASQKTIWRFPKF